MSYKAGTIKLISQCTIAATQDASFGLAFDTTFASVPTFTDLSVWANAVAPYLSTFATAIAGLSSTAVTYTGVRAEYYDGAPNAALVALAPIVGPGVGTGSPTQSSRAALVVGLSTNRPGRSYAGRVYVPACGANILATTRVSGSNGTSLRTALRAYAKNVETVLLSTPLGTVTPRLVVASRLLGTSSYVTSMRTDDLLDTQRRRENDFAPVYASTAY